MIFKYFMSRYWPNTLLFGPAPHFSRWPPTVPDSMAHRQRPTGGRECVVSAFGQDWIAGDVRFRGASEGGDRPQGADSGRPAEDPSAQDHWRAGSISAARGLSCPSTSGGPMHRPGRIATSPSARRAIASAFADADVARCYATRPPYAPALHEFLLGQVAGRDRALDPGYGPGKVAIVLAGHFAEVVAVDPSAAMIEAGRAMRGMDGAKGGRASSMGKTGASGSTLARIRYRIQVRSCRRQDLPGMRGARPSGPTRPIITVPVPTTRNGSIARSGPAVPSVPGPRPSRSAPGRARRPAGCWRPAPIRWSPSSPTPGSPNSCGRRIRTRP